MTDPKLLRTVSLSLHSGEPTADNQVTTKMPTKFDYLEEDDRFHNISEVSFKMPTEQPTHFAVWVDDKVIYSGPVQYPYVGTAGADTLSFPIGGITIDLMEDLGERE